MTENGGRPLIEKVCACGATFKRYPPATQCLTCVKNKRMAHAKGRTGRSLEPQA